MANCFISGGLDLSCATLQASGGGIKTKVWIGSLGALDPSTPYTFDDTAKAITALNWVDTTQANLFHFTGVKNQNSTSSNAQSLESGNANFPQSVTLTVHTTSGADLEVIYDMAFVQDLFVIVQTPGSNGRLEVFGIDLGLTLESAEKSSGNSPSDSTARTLVLSGDQTSMEKVFDIGTGLADSVTLLNGAGGYLSGT